MKSKAASLSTILLGFIAVGFLQSIINLANNRSLWLDEASLGLNIVGKPLPAFLEPLDHLQVAPIGFLLVEKGFATIGGNTDWSLRIFPFLLFLVSTHFMFQVAKRVLKCRNLALYATAFYLTSYHIILYSTEVKQYMGDVAFALALLDGCLRYGRSRSAKDALLLCLIGAVSVWFSNTAVIILFSCGLYLLCQVFKGRGTLASLLPMAFCWLGSFALYYYLFIAGHPARGGMIEYWSAFGAFLPSNVLSSAFFLSFCQKIWTLFRLAGAESFSLLAVPVFAVGVMHFWKQGKAYLLLLFFPIILHLLLAYLKLYPFEIRLILYLYPLLILLSIRGVYDVLLGWFSFSRRRVGYLLIIPLALNMAIVHVIGFPAEREEIKKTLTDLEELLAPDDQVYLYASAAHAFEFYESSFPKLQSHAADKFIAGSTTSLESADHLRDFHKLKEHVWLVFSHTRRRPDPNGELSAKDVIIATLKDKGYRIKSRYLYCRSSLYEMELLR